jgi:hypothetical protein
MLTSVGSAVKRYIGRKKIPDSISNAFLDEEFNKKRGKNKKMSILFSETAAIFQF